MASSEPASRHLALSLALAAAAVAASFTVLPMFLAVTCSALCRLGATARRGGIAEVGGAGKRSRWPWREAAVLAVLTFAVATAVFARERILSASDLTPTTVEITGLFEDELATVQVFRKDTSGHLRQLARAHSEPWRIRPGHYPWDHFRVILPSFAEQNLASLTLRLGDVAHRRDRRSDGAWRRGDIGETRMLMTTDAVRWQPGSAHWARAASHAAGITGTVLALWVLVSGLAGLATSLWLIPPGDARIVVRTVVGVAGMVAAPVWLLQRDGELFFGGTSGFLPDVVGSLVAATFGATTVGPDVAAAVWLGLAGTVLLAAAGVLGDARRRVAIWRHAAMVVVLAMVTGLVVVGQHHFLGTPYPTARTALFMIPLLWPSTLLCGAAIAVARHGRR